ncbi:UbiH/UbiF/VisC/COQ6 family ubiquinone biosynthesis hydroxylase [Novispirillum itersonii]|uniref:UbiH/UbiF/VisC/COQ6 family ubiquinone biosynthesis hydroxylase n=1 Tax=Novispirillum itersonii TaxID=189 RepID=UPI0003737D72|nr:UbiH/UbiF/VisC/COQ6 family ubiquinone biosynthesis hydroxylase [Novispirillum itersonii]
MSQTVSSSVVPPAAALTCDVVVVGGGLVGGTLACGLAQHGVSTICIDKDDAGVLLDTGYDGRSSAIALACQRVLEGTGVWAHMVSDVQPILDIRVTDSNSPLHLHYDHREVGAPMGYMAENRTIRRGILARFAELEKAPLLAPATVATVDRRVDGATVTLTDGRVIHTRLVVAADGRRSQIRDMAGIRLQHGLPYNQVGIVMTVWHEKDHRGIAHERFLPSGPFAILPLPGGHHSSLVWTEKDPLAWTILKLPDAEFQAELMSRFGDFLGEVKVVSKRFGYPLTLQHASRYIDLRLALVGDAAHGMHPVAGQGMNFGLRDVAALIEKVVEARRLGVDVGAATVLEGYQKWRRFDNVLMLGMTDGLVRLFSNDIAPLRLARTAGMAVVNRLPGLKRFFMRHAMGDVGALPKLMQGEPL